MDILVKMSDAWQIVFEFSQFQTVFALMFSPYRDVMTELFLPLSSVLPSWLYLGLDVVLNTILGFFPIGNTPFIAILVGQAVGLILSLHLLKLVMEALPIL